MKGFRQFANDINNKNSSLPTYDNFKSSYKPKTSQAKQRVKLTGATSKDYGDIDSGQPKYCEEKTKEQ